MRLEGKVAIVSGGAHGMGAVEAKLFGREGARVVIADIRDQDGQRIEAEINEAGGQALYVHTDVTDESAWANVVNRAVQRFGRLDVLVNNAGISSRAVPDDDSLDAWTRIMDINSTGVFLGAKHAIQQMQKNGGGSIVNISSIAGLVGMLSGHPAYNASKGSVRLFTKAMAVRYGRENIRVNSVHPGYMPPMMGSVSTEEVRTGRSAMVEDQVPMGREGRQEEVANAVLFLASDDASYITGPSWSWMAGSRPVSDLQTVSSNWIAGIYNAHQRSNYCQSVRPLFVRAGHNNRKKRQYAADVERPGLVRKMPGRLSPGTRHLRPRIHGIR